MRNGGSLAIVLQFLVHVEKHLGRQFLDLIAHVIRNFVAAFEGLIPASFESPMKSLVSLRQWLATAGDDLRDDRVSDPKCHEVTRVANSDVCGVIGLTNLVVFPNVEQLRMERSLKQMEHEFRNGRSNKAYIHWETCGLRGPDSVTGQETGRMTIVSSVFASSKAPPTAIWQLSHPWQVFHRFRVAS